MKHAEHMNPTKQHPLRHRILIAILALFGVAVVLAVSLCVFWLRDLPSVDTIEEFEYSQTTTVYAADEETVLAEFYLQDREPVELEEISENVLDATIATEDERFYEHGGIDVFGIARALVNNISGGAQQGASTITQQLVRNTILEDEASDISIKRKLREAVLAIQLENKYSKGEILNLYLNSINYGDNCYGIEAAAQHYFSKSASELTVLEAATLVGIPQSPTAYTPTVYPDACKERRDTVLQRMVDAGYLDQTEADEFMAQDIELNVTNDNENGDGIYKYPYFTSYVRETLLDELGTSEVYEGGLTVYTTLDPELQDAAEEACEKRYQTLEDSDAEIALVSIDPDTGYIKALVGGADYYENQFNLATQASRQAGSSFKAFTLTAAIQQGIDPDTMIDCSSPATLGTWEVENINNIDYGIRSIQSATAVSSNTGFARLVQEVGAENVVSVAHDMGIESELSAVDSITLGVSGVTPLEMCDAFATFASGGIQRDATAITKVIDRTGKVVYEWEDEGTRVLSKKVCSAAVQVLKTVFTEGTATSAALFSGQEAAGKTGTSEEYRDHWLCGFTPQLSTVVWIGSREEKSLPNIDCCSVWRSYMTAALADAELETFPVYDDPDYDNEFNSEQAAEYGTSSSTEYSSSDEEQLDADEEKSNSNRDPSSSGSSRTDSSNADEGDTGTSTDTVTDTPDTGAGDNGAGDDSGGADSATGG